MNNKKIGSMGEDIACKYLIKHGFMVRARNYSKAWGELDIIAEKDKVIHFFEVKSVVWNDNYSLSSTIHRPEDNVHALKISHIRRMIQTYMYEVKGSLESPFKFAVISVKLNMQKRMAHVYCISDIVV
jgi:putative endonuclease